MGLLFTEVDTAASHEYTVLRKVSLDAPFGSVTGFYGRGNDGQLEALRVASGLIPIRAGSVTLDAIDISKEKPDSRRVRLIFWNQTHADGQTVRQAMEAVKEVSANENTSLLTKVGLADKDNADVFSLSAEDRFMLHVAKMLLDSPQALLFEESFRLFSRPVTFRLIRRLKRLVKQVDCAFVYASSDIETMRAFADTYYVFDKGMVGGP